MLPNTFFENLQCEAYWKTQVYPFGAPALFAPHVIGLITTKIERSQSFISAGEFLKLIVHPAATNWMLPMASSPAAVEARLSSLMTKQVKNDTIKVDAEIKNWTKRARTHQKLNAWEKLDFDQHQAMIDEGRKRGPGTPESLLIYRAEMHFALRTSKFPYIRCQANLCLGTHPTFWAKSRRGRWLRMARDEANQLLTDHPNDTSVQELVRQVAAALVAHAAEPDGLRT